MIVTNSLDHSPSSTVETDGFTAMMQRGVQRVKSGHLLEALGDFQSCTILRPEAPEPWNNVGLTLMLLGRQGEALAPLDQALRLRPNYLDALTNRGRARQAIGDLSGALEDLDRAVACSSGASGVSTLMLRFALRKQTGDLEGAAHDLETVLCLNPNDPAALLNRGNLRLDANDVTGSLADLDRAVELIPAEKSAFARYLRGCARLQLRQYNGAVADFDAAIALEPANAVFYVARGNARFHRCDRRSALDYYVGLQLDQQKAGSEIVRLVAEHARINPDEVFENCERHLKVNPQDLIAHLRRGLTLRLLGRNEEADATMTRAAQLRPDLVELIHFLDSLASGTDLHETASILPSCQARRGG